MARSLKRSYLSRDCKTCGGPAVVVVLKDAGRFAANHVRVAHLPTCEFFAALKRQYPKLFADRVEAETDRLVSSQDWKK